MRTLLEEFWYENVNPQEQSTEGNREIKNLLNLMGKTETIFPIHSLKNRKKSWQNTMIALTKCTASSSVRYLLTDSGSAED